MAHAAPKLTRNAPIDFKLAPPEVATALQSWANTMEDAELKRDLHDELKGTSASGMALELYLDASRWADTAWAAVEATMPFDPTVSYRVGPYVVYVTPISKRGKEHRWRRVD